MPLGGLRERDREGGGEPLLGAAVVVDDASFILVKRKLRLSSRLKLCCQLIIADTPRALPPLLAAPGYATARSSVAAISRRE